MLFADYESNAWLQVLQVVAITAIGAWVGIAKKRIDGSTREVRTELAKEKKRCNALEKRVKVLEGKGKPAKPRPRKR